MLLTDEDLARMRAVRDGPKLKSVNPGWWRQWRERLAEICAASDTFDRHVALGILMSAPWQHRLLAISKYHPDCGCDLCREDEKLQAKRAERQRKKQAPRPIPANLPETARRAIALEREQSELDRKRREAALAADPYRYRGR